MDFLFPVPTNLCVRLVRILIESSSSEILYFCKDSVIKLLAGIFA